MRELEGTLIDGRWRLEASVTSCPGNIFFARDERSGAKVVVKLQATAWVPKILVEERRLGALIDHPVFVRVLDVGTDARLGLGYAVVQHAEGDALATLLERGPADTLEAVIIARELLAALEAAHAQGVILGPVAPREILVRHEASGIVVKMFATFDAREPKTATTVGLYAAPEHVGQIRFEPTVASDLYSVGALLHHMLAGEPPFEGKDALSLAAAIHGGKPAPIRSELGVPRSVQQAIWRALEKSPENRFRSARDFASALAL